MLKILKKEKIGPITKKILLFNEVPDFDFMKEELLAMGPVILFNNLDQVV